MSQLMEDPPHVRPDACGPGEVCEGVEVVGVAAVLGDEHRGPEPAQKRWHDAIECLQPWLVPRERDERQVGGRAAARPGAAVLGESGAGKQVAAALVER